MSMCRYPIKQVFEWVTKNHPSVITMEASGGYQAPVAAALGAAGLPVAVVNARQVREFACSMDILAKTDRLDALVVARFTQAARVAAKPLPAAEARELQELIVRRSQLVEQRARKRMRLKQAGATTAVARKEAAALVGVAPLAQDSGENASAARRAGRAEGAAAGVVDADAHGGSLQPCAAGVP